MFRTWSARLFAAAVLLWTGSSAHAQIVLRQTPLGPMPTDLRQITISPDGSRVVLEANVGSRQEIFVDGNEGQPYSAIRQMSSMGQGLPNTPLLMISADQTRVAYVATRGAADCVMVVNQKEGPVFDSIIVAAFAPVGHRLAYLATKANMQVLVNDSTVSPGYRNIILSDIKFSADGQHLGYVAQANDKLGTWRAVVDGKEGPAYTGVSSLQLSKSGHYAYVANNGNLYDNSVVVDGQAGDKYALIQPPVISDDGAHVGFVAMKKNANPQKFMAVIDGKEGAEFDQAVKPVFSPDGKHSVYAATDLTGAATAAYAIVDGKKSLDYVSCNGFLYSPDSQHLAYVAMSRNQKSVVVSDAKESDAHDSVDQSSMQFSPDSKRLAYVVSDQGRQYLVINGKVGPTYGAIDVRSFQFSPDGQHYHFKARITGSAWVYIIDDQIPAAGTAPAEVVTTADGQHSAAILIKNPDASDQEAQVLLDGKPVGKPYGRVEKLQISADGGHVAFVASIPAETGHKTSHVVFDGHEGPAYFRIDKVLLSPDGQHVAYACTEDGTHQYLVVDSFQGPSYNQVVVEVPGYPKTVQFRADGSLDFLTVTDNKLSRMVYTADMLKSLPKPAGGNGAAAPGYSEIYSFGQTEDDGATPMVLAAAPDGTLFGADSKGGEFQHGELFKVKPDGSGFTILHPFEGGKGDGVYPTSIRVAPDGSVYGTLHGEGKKGGGALYKTAADGSGYAVIQFFSPAEGDAPFVMAIDPDGTVFGLCSINNSDFRLFQIKPDGSDFKILYKSKPKPGGSYTNPIGPFVDGGDGYFYGVANDTIFKIKKDGSDYSIVRTFEGPPRDTNRPDQIPVLGSDKIFYGAASGGGISTQGIIYKIAQDGSGYTVIVNPKKDMLQPRALAEGPDGKLYALVREGIVRLNKDGSEYTVLKEMDGQYFRPTWFLHGDAFFTLSTSGGKGNGTIIRYVLGGPTAGAPTVTMQAMPPTPIDGNVDVPSADTPIKPHT